MLNIEQALALGFTLHVRRELGEAARVYRDALAIFPDNGEVCFRLANIERSRGNLEVAITLYRRATALRTGFWEAHGNLGLALEEAGRPDEAVPELAAAIRVAPNHAELHYSHDGAGLCVAHGETCGGFAAIAGAAADVASADGTLAAHGREGVRAQYRNRLWGHVAVLVRRARIEVVQSWSRNLSPGFT